PQRLELGRTLLLLPHPAVEALALADELLLLEAEPGARLVILVEELAVATREVAELAHRRQHLLAGRQREQQPQVTGAAETVERREVIPQVATHRGEPRLELADLLGDERGAVGGDALRRPRLQQALLLELELQRRLVELPLERLRLLLHAGEPRLQPRDLAAQPIELDEARVARRRRRGRREQRREREQRRHQRQRR